MTDQASEDLDDFDIVTREIDRQQASTPEVVGEALACARETRDPSLRSCVLDHLPESALLDLEWREFIRSSLDHRHRFVRQCAVEAIRRLRWTEAAAELPRLLSDRDHLVRVEPVQTLDALEVTESACALREILSTDPHRLVRCYAASALEFLEGEAAIPFLESRLRQERSPRVKVDLLVSLCVLGREEWLPELLRRLRTSRNYRVRHAVAKNLAIVANPANLDRIQSALAEALKREPTVAVRDALEQSDRSLREKFGP